MELYPKLRIVALAIPAGRVATYGQLALLCGQPRHSRQVGYALKRQRAGRDVPAHRVVNCRGELSGAIHFDMPDEQRLLLESEGVAVQWNGKCWQVDLKKYGWRNTLEEAEEFERRFKHGEQDEKHD